MSTKNEAATAAVTWTDATVMQLLSDRDTSRGRLGSVRAILNLLLETGGCGEQEMAIFGCIDLIDTVMDLNDGMPPIGEDERGKGPKLAAVEKAAE